MEDAKDGLYEKTMAAGLGALVTCLFVTPLDVVKVRMQGENIAKSQAFKSNHSSRLRNIFRSNSSLTLSSTGGTFTGIFNIARNEGIFRLWRGLSPSLVMALPATIVYYNGYEYIRDGLNDFSCPRNLSPLISGASARTIAVLITSPLELVKTKMQHTQNNSLSAIIDIKDSLRRDGLRILFRGLQASLMRDVPFSAIYWSSYEILKRGITQNISERDRVRSQMLVSFSVGASSGMIAAALTCPLDVAKTKSQVELGYSKSPWKHLYDIVGSEGISGLFRGIVPRMLKVAPACAIMISSYEFGKHYFASNRKAIPIAT